MCIPSLTAIPLSPYHSAAPLLQAIGPVAQMHVLCESYPWQVNGPMLVQHLIWEMEALGSYC